MIRKVRGLKVIINGRMQSMRSTKEQRIKQEFGRRVRSERKKKGLSQEALALACDLDRTYIGGIERGERNISLINMHKIADGLGVTLEDLVR